MGTIEYKPHCGKCGALIKEEITYQDIIVERPAISDYSYNAGVEICPYRCKNCGEIFDRIEIKPPRKMENLRIRK